MLFVITMMACKKTKPEIVADIKKKDTAVQQKMKPGNPIIKDVGMADPHIRIFNGKPYLYTTRDEDKTAQEFVMPDWKIWSSNDLVNWKLETTIDPTETYMGKSKRCWAPDAVYKNGNYYFYFSNGNTDTGVMISKSPIGPFKDVLGKPMLAEDLTPTKEYDPTVLIDDDETAYIAFGHHRSADPDYYFMIAKLNEDMVSLAETPKEIKIIGNVDVLGGNDKPTLHKKNGVYYLSAGSHYAISENIYGPYLKTGNSGNNNYGINSRAHGNYFDWNNQSFHTWCHFHLGKDVARYRESYISYLHYKENGEMITDTNFLDAHFSTGVGQYEATWDKIEAEWYMASKNVSKKENTASSNGFDVEQEQLGGYLFFPNVYQLSNVKSVLCSVLSPKGGVIEIRSGNENGNLLGEINISAGSEDFKNYSAKLSKLNEVENIYLIFKGKEENGIAIDWFKFE
jgi:beta-xylosidase